MARSRIFVAALGLLALLASILLLGDSLGSYARDTFLAEYGRGADSSSTEDNHREVGATHGHHHVKFESLRRKLSGEGRKDQTKATQKVTTKNNVRSYSAQRAKAQGKLSDKEKNFESRTVTVPTPVEYDNKGNKKNNAPPEKEVTVKFLNVPDKDPEKNVRRRRRRTGWTEVFTGPSPSLLCTVQKRPNLVADKMRKAGLGKFNTQNVLNILPPRKDKETGDVEIYRVEDKAFLESNLKVTKGAEGEETLEFPSIKNRPLNLNFGEIDRALAYKADSKDTQGPNGKELAVIAFKVKGDVAARMLQSAVPENLNDGIDDYASQNSTPSSQVIAKKLKELPRNVDTAKAANSLFLPRKSTTWITQLKGGYVPGSFKVFKDKNEFETYAQEVKEKTVQD